MLTQRQLAELYGVSIGTLNRYLGIIHREMENGDAD